jgi:hypothetical protein
VAAPRLSKRGRGLFQLAGAAGFRVIRAEGTLQMFNGRMKGGMSLGEFSLRLQAAAQG